MKTINEEKYWGMLSPDERNLLTVANARIVRWIGQHSDRQFLVEVSGHRAWMTLGEIEIIAFVKDNPVYAALLTASKELVRQHLQIVNAD